LSPSLPEIRAADGEKICVAAGWECVVAVQIEAFETRQLLSVGLDANGWTVVTPSVDTQTIYVSSSQGNDLNNGLSATTPVKSIAKATSLMRSGYPDWMLLRSGDVFSDSFSNWTRSGRSAQEPMVISSYGSGARPLLDTGTASAGFSTPNNASNSVNFLDVIGLQFYENNRDPASPTFNPNAAGGGTGFYFYAPGGNVLLENCSFSFYRYNLDIEALNGPIQNITLRRNQVTNAWGNSTNNFHSEGMYAYSVNNVTLYQNVFDHDGWNAQISNAYDTGYNHDVYFSSTVTGVDVEQNIFANASFAGVMARSGGIIDNNLFLQDAVAVSYGDANGADSTVGGVSGSLIGNVVVGDKALNGLGFGEGFDIGNTKPGGTLVANNIFTQDSQHAKPAIDLTMAAGTSNPTVCVGENDVTVENNITNGWWIGLETDSAFVPGGTGLYALNDLTVQNNDFMNATEQEVRHAGLYDPTQETFSGDRYYTANLPQSSWMQMGNNTISIGQWTTGYEPTATTLSSLPYADPNRSAATYDTTLGGPGTLADFLARAESVTYTNYQPQYMAQAVMSYVQKGFTLDTTPPTAVATLPNVNSASLGAAAYTFTVTYTDDFFIKTATLGANNILITGPNGYAALANFVGAAPSTVGPGGYQSTVATYQITPPGGSWASGQDGQYTITLLSNQVTDTAGNAAVGATLGTFAVDLTPPVAAVTALDIGNNSLGASSYSFSITYTDANGINAASIATGPIEVTGPNGYDQFATLTNVTSTTNAPSITATYTIPAPNGAWDVSAAGTYTINADAGGVQDTFGNTLAAGVLTTFNADFTGNVATSSISGMVFNDLNGNGIFDGRDLPMVGVVVFADMNGTGQLAANDPSTTTDSNGNYTLSGLAPGQYTIVEQLPAGYKATAPSSGTISMTLSTTQPVTGENFADQINQSGTSGSGGGSGSGSNGGTTSRHPPAMKILPIIILKVIKRLKR
jgi:SdrD B-like domain